MMQHLATNTRKARFAVQYKLMKMGALTPELKVRLGNTLIRVSNITDIITLYPTVIGCLFF